MSRSRSLFLVVTGLLAGCVWSPNDQDTVDRTAAFDVTGYSQYPSAEITLTAFNYATNTYDEIGTEYAQGSGLWSDPTLYPYAFDDIVLPSQYWVPPGGGCESTGMASLRVYENGYKMATYNDAQKECVTDMVLDGEHPAHAGYECGTSSQLVLFSYPTC